MNLLAAAIGIAMLRWAASPPDTRHMYGHEKAEYFSAGVEGTLILVAACAIAFAAVQRLFDQQALDEVGIGAAFSAVASLVNLAVGLLLVREERRQRLITVEADGRHLLTDVWTSAGVIAAVIAVALTSWWWLDPVIALVVALNIVVATGLSLLRRAGGGLMDRALPMAQQEKLGQALAPYRDDGIAFHAIRTRHRAFLLKEELRLLYQLQDPTLPPPHLDAWLAWASRSRLEPFIKLARTIRRHRDGILAAIRLRLTNGRLEGLNSRIRLISHRSFGFHSAAPLIALVYLCCTGIVNDLPR